MVGLVIVSHSATLAEGVGELAREMGGDVAIELAGGLELPDRPLGTDAALVKKAIEAADSGEGVLVLMDLGSAVLSAEMALEMLDPELRERVRLCEAPLVEGAVAAAATARIGGSLDEVETEARGGLQAKAAHLGADAGAPPEQAVPSTGKGQTIRLKVRNLLGLHARPAARFVQTAAGFDAQIAVTNATTGSGPASGRSLNAVATLGARQGHEIDVTADGPQAAEALAALEALAERDFDDVEPPTAPAATGPVQAADGKLAGLPASPGIVIAKARRLRRPEVAVPAHTVEDRPGEWRRLEEALGRVRQEIEQSREAAASRAGEYEAAIFEAHALFLEDEALLAPARHAILEEGRNAAAAWRDAAEEAASAYEALNDPYLAARAADVREVGRDVVAELIGGGSGRPSLNGIGIVIAPDLSPAETVALDPSLVRGIATAYGGPTSHGAILARALGIPAAVGLGEAVLALDDGTDLLLDGGAGLLVPDPSADLVAEYEQRQAEARAEASAAHAAAAAPALTSDRRRIEVFANVGSPRDVAAAVAAGAEGVGLFRTEFLFLQRNSLPDEEEQYEAYREAAEALDGRPLILRTLDVGADKPLPTLPQAHEANPFLGVRGIRLGFEQPDLLMTQLRAAVRVAAELPLKIMFPMVATLREWEEARRLVDDAGASANIEVGVMIEVPAAALSAEALAVEVDFFSIGTNDLTQYTMAAERGNERVAALGDALHPAVLRLIAQVTAAAEARSTPVGVCGELAGDPIATPVLIGLGVTELSMSAPSIPAVKQAVRAVDSSAAQGIAQDALRLESAEGVRRLVGAEAPAPR